MIGVDGHEEFDYFYERGKEAIPFGNETDLIEKAKYYSNNVMEAKKISEAGHRRALNDHTWSKRFDQLFNYLK